MTTQCKGSELSNVETNAKYFHKLPLKNKFLEETPKTIAFAQTDFSELGIEVFLERTNLHERKKIKHIATLVFIERVNLFDF